MKIKVHDIKLNDRKFTEVSKFVMFVPIDNESMIGWLQEFNQEPYTADNALHTYIRTEILYGSTKLDYKLQFVFDEKVQKTANDQFIIADISDCHYDLYKRIKFDLQLPAEIIVDTDDLLYPEYPDDDIEQTVFELLLSSLKLTISNIETV